MEKKLSQRQAATAASYYANENQQYKKLKTNVLLIAAILCVSVIMRYNEKSLGTNDNTKQYIDVPSHTVSGTIQSLHIA